MMKKKLTMLGLAGLHEARAVGGLERLDRPHVHVGDRGRVEPRRRRRDRQRLAPRADDPQTCKANLQLSTGACSLQAAPVDQG